MKKRLKNFIPFVLWAGLIFVLSAQPSIVSGKQSGYIAGTLQSLLGGFMGGEGVGNMQALYEVLDHLVRKSAHAAIYAILGMTALWGFVRGQFGQGRAQVVAAHLLCTLYAALDELHQFFVPGRGMLLSDVLLDSVGALVGIAGLIFFLRRCNKQKQ